MLDQLSLFKNNRKILYYYYIIVGNQIPTIYENISKFHLISFPLISILLHNRNNIQNMSRKLLRLLAQRTVIKLATPIT